MRKIILLISMVLVTFEAFAFDKAGWRKFYTNDEGIEFYYNVFQKNEWYDEQTVYENTEGDYELYEDIYVPYMSEATQKVLTKCIEHGSIVEKDTEGEYFCIIYYLGAKANRYHSFAQSGWFNGEE